MNLLHVSRWVDPVIDPRGYPATSAYCERFWLPVLGPSCLVVLRRFTLDLAEHPDGLTYPLSELAASVGLPGSSHRGGGTAFERTLRRLEQFRVARWSSTGLMVRTVLDRLGPRLVQRLPEGLAMEHTRLMHEGAEI